MKDHTINATEKPDEPEIFFRIASFVNGVTEQVIL